VGPPVSEAQILAVIPESFSGKEKFMKFYLYHNGGKLNGFVYRDRIISDPENDLSRVEVEKFFFIPNDPDQVFPPLRSISKVLRQRSSAYAELIANGDPDLQPFLSSNYPIAADASDNTFWLEVPSGRIRRLEWERCKEGPRPIVPSFIPIARSFQAFVENFKFDPDAELRLKEFLAIVERRAEKGPTGYK
jgi:hypothetical protein